MQARELAVGGEARTEKAYRSIMAAGHYRAVTAGRGEEWIVLDGRGDEIFRGDPVYAARVAARLNASRI